MYAVVIPDYNLSMQLVPLLHDETGLFKK